MSGTYVYEWDSDGDGTFSTDISAYVLSCKTKRGRRNDLDRMPAGTATLVLNNEDGRFSPDKAAGPYYGKLKPYRRIRIKGTVVGASTYGIFYGFVLDWTIKSKATQQTVTWFIGDRFALWQHMKLNLPLLRKLDVLPALHVAVNRAEGLNVIANPSLEQNADDWSAIGGATGLRDDTMKGEGDWSYRADCPGAAGGEGIRYTATADYDTNDYFKAGVLAKCSEGTVSVRLRAIGAAGELAGFNYTLTTSWQYLPLYFTVTSQWSAGVKYFDLYTNQASEVIIWVDALQGWEGIEAIYGLARDFDSGTAEIELAASYRQPALPLLQDIAESDPRSFFFLYMLAAGTERLRWRDKDWRATAIAAGPVSTFSDDGADVPWFDVLLTEKAVDRISEAEVASQGDFQDENEEATIWELSPAGYEVPAAETKILHAFYSQPCRDCSLVLNSPDATPRPFDIAVSGDDGFIKKYAENYPPVANTTVDTNKDFFSVGQAYAGPSGWDYHALRAYVRFNTAPIPDAAPISAARLRLKLFFDWSGTNFTIRARQFAWGGTLEAADWRAVPGNDPLLGTFNSADLPPAGEWFEIEIDTTHINKTGYTEIYLTSDREEAGTTPTEHEEVWVDSYDGGSSPQLIVTYDYGPESETFENYGVGARIAIEAPADAPVIIDTMKVSGVPLRGSSEESKVVEGSANPSAIERTLHHALPLQGTRTASMETEADRLADRYDDDAPPKRISLILRPKNDTVLTQMLLREIGELIHVENINDAFSTWIDGNFWIEGIYHDLGPGGKHTTTFHLESQ